MELEFTAIPETIAAIRQAFPTGHGVRLRDAAIKYATGERAEDLLGFIDQWPHLTDDGITHIARINLILHRETGK